jgi:hypothetical protein
VANEKISELPIVTPAEPSDIVPIVRGGQNYGLRVGDIAAEGVAVSAGTSVISTGTAVYANANNVSIGAAGQTVTFSASYPTTAAYYFQGNTIGQSSSSTALDQTLSISAGGLVSAGWSNGSLLLSGTQSTQPLAYSGSNGSSTANTLSFGASNGLSHYLTNGSVVASYTVPSTAGLLSSFAVSASNTSTTATGLTLSNSNNVSFGLTAGHITASASYAAGPNYTINGGATTGTLALVSSGTLSFAGIGNITLSQVGNAITISGGSAVTTPAPINVTANGNSANAATLQFNNSNGVTFGFSTGVGLGTITASVLAQSTQPVAISGSNGSFTYSTLTAGNLNGLSFYTSGGSLVGSYTVPAAQTGISQIIAGGTTASAGTISFSNAHNVSFGLSTSNNSSATMTASYALNVSAAGGTSNAVSGLTFANSNNITFGLSTGAGVATLTASVGAQGTAVSGLQVSNTTYTSGTVTFQNANGISFGSSGANGISASYNSTQFAGSGTTFSGTNIFGSITLNSAGINLALSGGAPVNVSGYLAGNTTVSTSGTAALSSFNVSGAGIISAGWSSNSLIISAPASTSGVLLSAGLSNIGNTSGTTGLASNQLVLAGGANITLSGSTNGGSMTISVVGGAGGGGGGVNFGISTFGNTAGSTGTVSTGNVVLVGSGPISLSQSTGAAGSAATITINAPATSSLSGLGGISVSTNGSTIYVSGGQVSFYQALPTDAATFTQLGQNSVWAYPLLNPDAFSASRADVFYSASESNLNLSTYANTVSLYMGLYSRTASTLSLASSGSQTYAWVNSSNQSSGSLTGLRRLSVPINVNYTGGDLWFAMMSQTTFANTNGLSMSNMVIPWGNTNQLQGLPGEASNNTKQFMPGMGVFSTTSAVLPASMAFSAITGLGSGGAQYLPPANFVNVTF